MKQVQLSGRQLGKSLALLIADLEAATEGSRELSDRVLLACGCRPIGSYGGEYGWKDQHDCEIGEPDPTRSLDDALAQVPEGLALSLDWPFEILPVRASWRFVGEVRSWVDAATAPLAVCIAVLKAQEQDR